VNVIHEKIESDCLQVASRLFGPLNVPVDTCLSFQEGIFGFAGERHFVLLPAAKEGLYWMQDVNDGALALLLVDPFKFFPDYSADLDDAHHRLIDASDEAEVAVLSVVTLPRAEGDPCTVNLQGPIIVNFTVRKGCQVILDDSGCSTKHPIDLDGPPPDRTS
jgi:flagellar assembly factor FliW